MSFVGKNRRVSQNVFCPVIYGVCGYCLNDFLNIILNSFVIELNFFLVLFSNAGHGVCFRPIYILIFPAINEEDLWQLTVIGCWLICDVTRELCEWAIRLWMNFSSTITVTQHTHIFLYSENLFSKLKNKKCASEGVAMCDHIYNSFVLQGCSPNTQKKLFYSTFCFQIKSVL